MVNLNEKFVIAIDGGAASGKSTLAKALANRLNVLYIDTGSMYRAFALYFLEKNIEVTKENVLKNIDKVDIKLVSGNSVTKVYLNGVDVSDKIRENIVSITTPKISIYKPVREYMLNKQRQYALNSSVVMDGRDIGTVVFPNANLKIYLIASYEQRAIRRQNDLKKIGRYEDIETLKEELKKRDIEDMTREISPLKKADDAVEIDTTGNTLEETLNIVMNIINE